MKRIKTFCIYALILIAFFLFSKIAEEGLLKQMYYNMTGTIDNTFVYGGEEVNLNLTVTEAKCTRRNGYIYLTVENNTSMYIAESYIKVDLYSKSGVHAVTKYMEIKGLSGGESKTYKLKFSGSYINEYAISLSRDYPNKQYIINVLGYDIDTTNIFGMDLSEYINADNFTSFGKLVYNSIVGGFRKLPWGEAFLFYLVFLCAL